VQQNRAALPLMYCGIVLAAIAVYGGYLDGPLFFDDFGTVDVDSPVYSSVANALSLRWLPYASMQWTRAAFAEPLVWLRAGNLLLHAATGCVLFTFLRRLFAAVCAPLPHSGPSGPLALHWIAFGGTLLFVLHPAATYGVAYLVQRAGLMATLFALLTWWSFVEGMLRNSRPWMIGSALAYLLSVLAKEHALLVPLGSLALLVLLRDPKKKASRLVWLPAALYVLIAGLILYQFKVGHIIGVGGIAGQAYEPNAKVMLADLGIAAADRYFLSVLTQSTLFFKYLLLWLLPNPSWMSVAMEADFARSYFAWPYALGPFLFVAYAAFALRLLFRRGRAGLLGFALIMPAALFLIELSTVRIQEIFVLYRSYLWMPCIGCALPYLLERVEARRALAAMTAVVLLLSGFSLNRMNVFAETLRLWDEALQLAGDTRNRRSLGRIYHNRGLAYLNRARYDEALADFNNAIRLAPGLSNIYNDRAVVFLETKRYREALADYDFAIMLAPTNALHYLGRARTNEALGRNEDARRDLMYSCRFGNMQACAEMSAR